MSRIWDNGFDAGGMKPAKKQSFAALRPVSALALALLCLLAFISCGTVQGTERPGGKTVMTVGEYDIGEEEYNYYYLNSMENDGMTDAEAKEAAKAEIVRRAAVLTMAKKYGIELSKEERDAVKAEMEAVEEQLTKQVFEEQLESYHMTRGLYLYLSQTAKLEQLLREYVMDERSGVLRYDDKAVLNDIHENFIAVRQILIPVESGDDRSAAREKADEALSALRAGGDFGEIAEKYGKDEAADPVYGRYFTHGMYPAEFEKEAAALRPGEISGVVETDVGYHVIMRIPQDEGYIDKNFEQLRYLFLNRCFNEMLDEVISGLEVVEK
ncbi:MAG: peptidylprolyl isomerase [Clostridia bacterium]|nr:peptidylprolyl isomerase [Clostridia bacterium]